MENFVHLLQEVFSNVGMFAGYLATLVTLASTLFAVAKAIKEKKYGKIKDLMYDFIAQAEEFKCKNGQPVDGAVKKEIVLGKLKTACGNFGVTFDEQFWSDAIDTGVEFSKVVNKRI